MVEKQVRFDKSAYSLDAIKKGAYRFINSFSAEIINEPNSYLLILRFSESKSNAGIEATIEDFRKEVLDQDLRISIRAQTEPYRNLILSHVFSRTTLIRNE